LTKLKVGYNRQVSLLTYHDQANGHGRCSFNFKNLWKVFRKGELKEGSDVECGESFAYLIRIFISTHATQRDSKSEGGIGAAEWGKVTDLLHEGVISDHGLCRCSVVV